MKEKLTLKTINSLNFNYKNNKPNDRSKIKATLWSGKSGGDRSFHLTFRPLPSFYILFFVCIFSPTHLRTLCLFVFHLILQILYIRYPMTRLSLHHVSIFFSENFSRLHTIDGDLTFSDFRDAESVIDFTG